jgi:hypothetical protein
MLDSETELIQRSIALNPLGTVAVAVGCLLLLCIGLLIRQGLVRWDLRGRWRVVEWLMWTCLLTGICIALPVNLEMIVRPWELKHISDNSPLGYAVSTVFAT